MIDVDILIRSLPETIPFGSKRVKMNASTNSSSGTPYCKPRETAMAKEFMRLLNAAPSLCISMKTSPMVPSSYSPVRRYTLWPPVARLLGIPRRRAGNFSVEPSNGQPLAQQSVEPRPQAGPLTLVNPVFELLLQDSLHRRQKSNTVADRG